MSITLIIVIITCIVSIAALNNNRMKSELIFWPAVIKNNRQYYRFLSYGLIHADYIHLSFNMIALYTFGSYLENDQFSAPGHFGSQSKIFFLILYITALVVSTVADYMKYKDVYGYTALGASGAVSAVIFASIILRPDLPVMVLFLELPGWVFGILFVAFSAYFAKKGNSNIGHSAHLFGALYGLAFTVIAIKMFSPEHTDVLSNFVKNISNALNRLKF